MSSTTSGCTSSKTCSRSRKLSLSIGTVREFESVVRAIRQKGDRLLTPNVKENSVSWSYELDHAVEDFEQLIFILNHGLDILFRRVAYYGLSTEHLDISFRLSNKTKRRYVIKTSFPTLERSFWLKLINLRVSLDPPEAGIVSLDVVSFFTKPRPSQRGLYAVSRPEPESLLLTVNKLKKLVGEENVGIPVLLDQRLARPFALDADSLPVGQYLQNPARQQGRNDQCTGLALPYGQASAAIVAFSYYRPPHIAEVLVRDGRLVFVKNTKLQRSGQGIQRSVACKFEMVGHSMENARMGHRDRIGRCLPTVQSRRGMVFGR
jgi:hypothetical protein